MSDLIFIVVNLCLFTLVNGLLALITRPLGIHLTKVLDPH